MKEIKFRVYDSFSEEMYTFSKICNYPISNFNLHHYTVMQFTGFKDKNKKEIYDGDILSDFQEVDGELTKSFMQVFWCKTTGAWKLDNSFSQNKSSGDLLSEELILDAYEISGNTFENSELLINTIYKKISNKI